MVVACPPEAAAVEGKAAAAGTLAMPKGMTASATSIISLRKVAAIKERHRSANLAGQ